MIETDVSGGFRTEDHRAPRTSSRRRSAWCRAALDAHVRADAVGDPAGRRGRPTASGRNGHGAVAARDRLPRRSRATAPSSFPGKMLVDIARLLPARRGYDRARPEEAVRARHLRERRATRSTRTTPRTSRGCPRSDAVATFTVDRAAAARDDRRVARSASRDETRPVLTGILVRFGSGQARHGGDRLVPSRGQGDRDRRDRCPDLEAIVPAPGAAGARAHRRRRRRARARRPGEPGRVRRPTASG